MTVQSVIQHHGLAGMCMYDIRADRAGWLVTVVRGQTARASFPLRPGTPVSVRLAVERGLGVEDE